MKREQLYILGDGDAAAYYKSEADAVMDGHEARIKELEAEVIGYKASLERANFKMCEKDARIKELESDNERLKAIVDDEEYKHGLSGLAQRNAELREENERLKAQVPKWISVKDRLPNIGDIVLVYFDERVKSHYFPIDVVRWDSSYELQEISVTHWMPLPPPPTTEESSATEKED